MKQIEFILIVISDRAFRGVRQDQVIPRIKSWCKENNLILDRGIVIPDDEEAIRKTLSNTVNTEEAQLIITSGGTGFSPKDITPEVTSQLIKKRTPGIDEYLRTRGMEKTPYSILSRGVSGIIYDKLIINLPGNPDAVIENMNWLKTVLPHALSLIRGDSNDAAHKISNGY
jgi:molybdopterin adenylyltransferase